MNKLFLATTFSGQVNYETGQVNPVFRESIEAVLKSLRTLGGFSVFCAVEHEGWKVGDEPPHIGVAKDKAEIDAADGLLALLQPVPSEGVQWEIGYATGKKPVMLAHAPDVTPGYFNQGLITLGEVSLAIYNDPNELTAGVVTMMGDHSR